MFFFPPAAQSPQASDSAQSFPGSWEVDVYADIFCDRSDESLYAKEADTNKFGWFFYFFQTVVDPPPYFVNRLAFFARKCPQKYTECKLFVVGKGQIYQNLRTSASLTFRIIYSTDILTWYIFWSRKPPPAQISATPRRMSASGQMWSPSKTIGKWRQTHLLLVNILPILLSLNFYLILVHILWTILKYVFCWYIINTMQYEPSHQDDVLF